MFVYIYLTIYGDIIFADFVGLALDISIDEWYWILLLILVFLHYSSAVPGIMEMPCPYFHHLRTNDMIEEETKQY